MIMHNHMDRLKRKRSFSWLLIARKQRKLRKRLHSKRKIPQARERQKTWPMPIEYFSDIKVEFHILVKLLLISFSKFIPSWSRPFNIEISWQRSWFICFRVLIRGILFISPLLSSVILADLLLMTLISDQIFSNSFAKFMSIRLLYEGRYESRHRIGEDLSCLS